VLIDGWTIVDGRRIAPLWETHIDYRHIKSNGDGPTTGHGTSALTLGGNHHTSLTIIRLKRYSESPGDDRPSPFFRFVSCRLGHAIFHGLGQMLGYQRRKQSISLG